VSINLLLIYSVSSARQIFVQASVVEYSVPSRAEERNSHMIITIS